MNSTIRHAHTLGAFWLPLFLIGVRTAQGAPADSNADAVLGQTDFTSIQINRGGAAPTASTLSSPRGLVVDPATGRLFVADSGNNRVLSWASASAFANGLVADIVLGQADFAGGASNQGDPADKPTARTLSDPRGVAIDAAGRLYVADSGNKRILRFDPPITTNAAAVQVFGQNGDFTTNNQASAAAPTADNLGNPDGIAVDSAGNLYCADRFLHRVVIYQNPVTSDTTADLVLGQPDLTTTGNNQNNANPTANTLAFPIAVGLDADGNLYVADEGNNRVLLFEAPLTSNENAVRVFGQPDFTSGAPNNPAISATSMFGPVSVAIDRQTGNLFVADAINSRILEFTSPRTDSTADRVFGQLGDATTGVINKGGAGAGTLNDVAGVALGASGHLYAGDRNNNRVLRFDAAGAPPGGGNGPPGGGSEPPGDGPGSEEPPAPQPVGCGFGAAGPASAAGASLLLCTLASIRTNRCRARSRTRS